MLCYSTSLKLRPTFTIDQLLDLTYDYLGKPTTDTNRKNKNYISTLDRTNMINIDLKENNRRLETHNYEERKIFAIQYIFTDEDKNTDFIIELIYQYGKENRIHLQFSKQLYEDAYYLSNVSLPRLFKTLITNDYIQRDYDLECSNKIAYGSNSLYKRLSSSRHNLPLVILRSAPGQRRMIFNPVKLAESLLGIAHIVCLRDQQEHLDEVEIIYPDEESIFVQEKKPLLIEERIREYMITKTYQTHYTYQYWKNVDQLEINNREINKESVNLKELRDLLKDQGTILEDLQTSYQNLVKENDLKQQSLQQKKDRIQQLNNSLIHISSIDPYDDYRDLMIDILENESHIVDDNGFSKWRRKDVIRSIYQKNKEEQ